MPRKTGLVNLRLTSFRSYDTLNLSLDESFCPVVLTGQNGAGKTNILEAISFLSPGRGLRAARLADVAKREDGALPAQVLRLPVRWSVAALFQTPTDAFQIGTGTIDGSERRQVKIDGKIYGKQSALGEVFRCLWLTPAQDRLFCTDPAARRRFLDRLVQAFDPSHAVRTTNYMNAFKQWSCLLKEGRFDTAWLEALEQQIALNGVAISAARKDVVERISTFLTQEYLGLFPLPVIQLTGVIEKQLQEKPAVLVEEDFVNYLKSNRKKYAEGGCIAGPHTADFSVIHRGKNCEANLCSTGEQKALLLSIILAQLQAQQKIQNLCPLLLLDEVGAHLDERRKEILFDILLQLPTQVWMTGIQTSAFQSLMKKAQFWEIKESAFAQVA